MLNFDDLQQGDIVTVQTNRGPKRYQLMYLTVEGWMAEKQNPRTRDGTLKEESWVIVTPENLLPGPIQGRRQAN